MQKISFGNREYVKASEVAKRFKYTQDYVGQLCRNDKVDARLVGRAWYVNLDSVSEYRKTKHATQKKEARSQTTTTPATHKSSRRSAVEPVVRPKTARNIQATFPKEAGKAVKHVAAKYSPDKATTIPVLSSAGTRNTSPAPSDPQTIKPRPKVTIKVKPNTKKATKYHAEKLPEITLNSKLKVSDQFENLVPENTTQVSPSTSADTVAHKQPAATKQAPAKTHDQPPKTVSFHPRSVVERSPRRQTTVSDASSKPAPAPRSAAMDWMFFVLYACGVMLVGFVVLGIGYVNEAGGTSVSSGLTFSLAVALENLLGLLQ